MDDGELIAATVRGDADAFAKLYRRHLPRVVVFGLRATGDPEVAADLAAEVFAAALASCARYRPEHDSYPPDAEECPGMPRRRLSPARVAALLAAALGALALTGGPSAYTLSLHDALPI